LLRWSITEKSILVILGNGYPNFKVHLKHSDTQEFFYFNICFSIHQLVENKQEMMLVDFLQQRHSGTFVIIWLDFF
jgi:hypothetical protein